MPKPNFRRVRIIFLKGLSIALGLYLVTYLGLSALAGYQERAVKQAWSATLIDPDTFPARYPKQDRNETAQFLAEAFKPDGGRFEITREKWSDLPLNAAKVLQDNFNVNSDAIAIPAELQAYLERHAADFDAVYAQVRKQSPVWELDLAQGLRAPVVNLLQQRSFVTLMCLDALNKTARGRHREALDAFECAWNTVANLRERPELLSQLVAIWLDTQTSLTLRKLHDVPTEWQDRIVAHDYRKSVLVAYEFDGWVLHQACLNEPTVFSNGLSTSKNLGGAVFAGLSRPYLRLGAAQAFAANRAGIELLQNSDACALGRNDVSDRMMAQVGWWNVIGKIAVPNLGVTWRSALRMMLRNEGTRNILTAKAVMREDTVSTVGTPDGTRIASRTCPNAGWNVAPNAADSSVSFTLDRPVPSILKDEETSEPGLKTLAVTWKLIEPAK